MKAFLLALVFFGLAVVATGFFYEGVLSRTASEAYSSESVRVGGENPVEQRVGWEGT